MAYDFTVRISSIGHAAAFAAKRGWPTRADDETLHVELPGGSATLRFDVARGVVHFSSTATLAVSAAEVDVIGRRVAALNGQLALPGLVVRAQQVLFVAHAILDDDDAVSELTLDRLLRRVVDEVGHVPRVLALEPAP